MSARVRLDVALLERGLVQSRARARDAILRGTVLVNGHTAHKAGLAITDTDIITVADPAADYVARSALKLIAGLEFSGFDPVGLVCLDLGASTGGFTQVLAERGARKIYAVDVGHGQLHPRVSGLPEVISLEGTDARALDRTLVPDPIELLVCDVSFVSLVKIIGPALALCAPDARAVLLIKPQFEVGRDHIGKGGLVVPGPHVEAAINAVISHQEALGWRLQATIASPIAGGDGNRETIATFIRANVGG
ncbi:TlyA family RNA methyltransferase [Pelagibacterium montanilacus]|uniref:TlyA family RNA methyltransferase n=1 Tax=Pelagibacterium montanilacus TaxID=2185280 RepID=UPI000F8F0B57|nr:TlyA family RNA methyltransferase [Pelagibacterium montanilacus]